MPLLPVVRASGSSRIMKCSGPAFLQFKHDIEQHEAGPQGTAAGELFEILAKRQEPKSLQASSGVFFDDDMRFNAEKIIPYVPVDAIHQLETEWVTSTGTVIKGTLDTAWVEQRPQGLVLVILDYKYGFIIHEVVEHYQLLNYAIGLLTKYGGNYVGVELIIGQPRAHHEDGVYRKTYLTMSDLAEVRSRIDSRIADVNNGDRTLVSGPHCRYCPYLAKDCPAAARVLNNTLHYVLVNGVQDDMTPDEVSNTLDLIAEAERILEFKKDALEQYAKSVILSGGRIPNYIMVDNKSKRTFLPHVNAALIEMLTGIKGDEIKLKSPYKLEKEGADEKTIAKLCSSSLSGKTLKKVDEIKYAKKLYNIK